MSKGLIAAILAFTCWGLFPIYWKFFHELTGLDLFAHRLIWSFVTLWFFVFFRKSIPALKNIWQTPKRKWLILSAILISTNWLIYVKAVTEGHIIEASMGYFLNPLINVLIGGIFLKETLRKTQLPAIFCAAIGVFYLVYSAGLNSFPWIAISLSFTFALYGVIRKLVDVNSLDGLTFETTLVFTPFMLYWFYQGGSIGNSFEAIGPIKSFALILSGFITCIPLVLFAYAARNLKLQTLGFAQYLSPSFKFICGWLIFHEPLSQEMLTAFIFIWIGLIFYTVEASLNTRKNI